MKTYNQRCADVAEKITRLEKQRKKRRIASLSVCLSLAVVMTLVLFLPLDQGAPDISRHSGSPYYALMQSINEATYKRPAFKYNYEKLANQLDRGFGLKVEESVQESPQPGEDMVPEDIFANGEYVEVTDNQVSGVTEADIIKRSNKYIFYLRDGRELSIYSIEGENSREVGNYDLQRLVNSDDNGWFEGIEMYLSRDCHTVYIISRCNRKTEKLAETYTVVTALDVTDVTDVKKIEQIYMTGDYLTSRMVGEDLLLMGQYQIRADKDFSDQSTFLPMVGPQDNMKPIAAEDIFAPEKLTTTRYTVVCKVDGQTLAVKDSAAFLSYSQELYVSAETIYATRSFTEKTETGSRTMTQITALGYSGETMEPRGSINIAGTVKNQYSMDEYKEILRVVTSTSEQISGIIGADMDRVFVENRRNVNLTCIDLQTMEVVASVEAFAPEGETAESVRFDGDMAYVCTAEVITLTDPVYFFDLSNLQNITWKDTGTIDGYSSSLVNFCDGYLLGIGYNGMRELKIEIYDQAADGVESVCAYERSASFSEEYKSYLINRENGLIGLAVRDYSEKGYQYVLLMFDGYELRTLVEVPIYVDRQQNVRAVMIDGWLYILTGDFVLYKVW